MTALIDKLDRFDTNAHQAVDQLIAMLNEHRDEIITVARARHITGHFVHGDTVLFEYTAGRLMKETFEELADAVVYMARRADVVV